jgi:hypothetical protein
VRVTFANASHARLAGQAADVRFAVDAPSIPR